MMKTNGISIQKTDLKKKALAMVKSRDFWVMLGVLSLLILANTSFAGGIDSIEGASGNWEWPWTRFFANLAKELTGPLPLTLGIIAIAGAAFSLFAGHGGPGTQKFFVLIFAIGICLFAPTFISYVKESADAATIADVIGSIPR